MTGKRDVPTARLEGVEGVAGQGGSCEFALGPEVVENAQYVIPLGERGACVRSPAYGVAFAGLLGRLSAIRAS